MKKEEDIFKIYNDIDNIGNNTMVKETVVDDEDAIIYIEEENIATTKADIIEKENSNKHLESEIKVDNNKQKQNKKRKSSKIWVILFAFFDAIAIGCLFLMYGPISYFRNLWVTSSMMTMTHQYLAYIFFDGEQIKNIMANNSVIESKEETNIDDIFISNEDPGEYSSIYEEQILKRDPGNDIYKVIDIAGSGYKGHMLVVYDPSRIDLIQAPNLPHGGKQLETLVEINDAYAGINASGFYYSEAVGYIPSDVVIMNNELIWGNKDKVSKYGGIIGFNNDNVLVLTKTSGKEALEMGIRDAVSFGPFLIVNGEPAQFTGNGGYGIAPRTAIGQRKDGIVLMLVIDGRRPGHSLGVDMVELTNILMKYGAYNASNLDGGGSSSLVVDGEVLSIAGGYGYSGERYLPNAWIVK